MSFWDELAVYCENLAPVATPAVATLGSIANAVSTADRQIQAMNDDTRRLRAQATYLESVPLLTEDDLDG
jgi:hypothetical protein